MKRLPTSHSKNHFWISLAWKQAGLWRGFRASCLTQAKLSCRNGVPLQLDVTHDLKLANAALSYKNDARLATGFLE